MPLTLITDTDYPGKHTYNVTSITRSGSVATVTTAVSSALASGMTVTIAGAVETEYNGNFVITVTGATTFTYTVTGTPATPATGTITAYGGKVTVPGIVYLDGYFFVMDEDARIYNSALGDGSSWNALEFITAEKEPGSGKAIAKSANYVIAFKSWSTEFFYDAANAVGSPLSPVDNGFTLVGCASGTSVTNLDGTLFWIAQTRQKGRSVYMMEALQQGMVSTPDVDRILNADDLSTVYSYGIKIAGHSFYVLTLVNSNITLVYDAASKAWQEWSSLTPRASVSVSSITSNGIQATVTTAVAHGLSDGDPVTIAGASVSSYNTTWQAKVVSSTVFKLDTTLAAPTGTITAVGYDETYFKYTKYVFCSGKDLVLHETNGNLYEITEQAYTDAGNPIDVLARTDKIDGGTVGNKVMNTINVVGNKIDDTAQIRWSDDDCQTFSAVRTVDLGAKVSQVRRCGDFTRRSIEFRYAGNKSLQVAALELEG